MKYQSKKKLRVKGAEIGGEKTLVCIPLRGQDSFALDRELDAVLAQGPDMIEWQMDYFNPMVDADFVRDLIGTFFGDLAGRLGDVPLLFSFRPLAAGGAKYYSDELRKNMLASSVRTGHADLVEVGMDEPEDLRSAVLAAAAETDTRVALSHYDLAATEDEGAIIERAKRAQAMGADVARLVYSSRGPKDDIAIARACKRMKTEGLVDIPLSLYAMNDSGFATRMLGANWGNDICSFTACGAYGGREEDAALFRELSGLLEVN